MNDVRSRLIPAVVLTLALTAGALTPAGAQTLHDYRKPARKLLAEGDSLGALAVYRRGFEGVTSVIHAPTRYEVGQLAEALGYYTVAKQQYGVLAASDFAADFPDVRIRLAEAQRETGVYEAALSNYRAFLAADSTSALAASARAGIAEAEWAMSRSNDSIDVRLVQLPETVNTLNSEFGGVAGGPHLYFSRLQLADYPRRSDTATESNVRRVDTSGAFVGGEVVGLHPGQHVAHTARSPRGERVYFTVCENLGPARYRCDLYVAGFSESGPVGEARRLPDAINLAGYTQTNPTVGVLRGDDAETLFFASDRPGGQGGMDLYGVRLDGSGFPAGEPFAIEGANTRADDVTPFFHQGAQRLFFSSRGHRTLGGYDIFRLPYLGGGAWGEVTGLKAPVNSVFDDTYYSLDDASARTYFSSNRPGATCDSTEIQECCGLDVYYVEVTVELEAVFVAKCDTAQPIVGVDVQLYDAETDALIAEASTAGENRLRLPLAMGRSYRLVARHPDFDREAVAEFDTREVDEPTLIRRELFFPELDLEVMTFARRAGGRVSPLVNAELALRKVGSEDLFEQRNPRGNDFRFALEPGARYALTGRYEDFVPDSVSVVAPVDRTCLLRDTLVLRQPPPPIVRLYFDNDFPAPRSRDSYTDSSYAQLFARYITQVGEFEAKQGSAADREEIRDFFGEVRGNYARFESLADRVRSALVRGDSVGILVDGYASPIASSSYNDTLSMRRTWTVYNYLFQRDTVLRDGLAAAALRLILDPHGELATMNGEPIEDSPARRRKSEWGLAASRARYVDVAFYFDPRDPAFLRAQEAGRAALLLSQQ